MQYELIKNDNFLLIKLSGITSPNDRLVTMRAMTSRLERKHPRVIVDLSGLKEKGEAYVAGVLNTIRKEVQVRGGEIKLCALGPKLHRFFQENRLLELFETETTVEQAKQNFRKDRDEEKS